MVDFHGHVFPAQTDSAESTDTVDVSGRAMDARSGLGSADAVVPIGAVAGPRAVVPTRARSADQRYASSALTATSPNHARHRTTSVN
jgi:hypothetical protein